MELIVVGLIILIVCILGFYYTHVARLENLLKAKNLPEYYRATQGKEPINDPNSIAQAEDNEILLDDSRPFDLPEEFNLEKEGEVGHQTIKIYKD